LLLICHLLKGAVELLAACQSSCRAKGINADIPNSEIVNVVILPAYAYQLLIVCQQVAHE